MLCTLTNLHTVRLYTSNVNWACFLSGGQREEWTLLGVCYGPYMAVSQPSVPYKGLMLWQQWCQQEAQCVDSLPTGHWVVPGVNR